MDGGFPPEQGTLEISNDDAVRAWIENLSEVLERREAGFIKDGYEWRIEDFGGFDFKFSPRMEHRFRKWTKKQEKHEPQKKRKERIENEAKEMKEKSKKWVMGNKLKIGRIINLPKWWFKKVGADIVTDKNDCVYRSILRSVIKKRTPHQSDYEEAHKKFIWEQDGYCFPIEGPVTRKDMLQWNKMNPNYYLCVYGYEGLDEKTYSIMFVNLLRPFILPPDEDSKMKNKQ